MRRRRFLAGLGTVFCSGAIVTGGSAFSSIDTERSVQVGIVNDSRAYLRLEDDIPTTGSTRATVGGGQIAFEIGLNDDILGVEGDGPGSDSIYEFPDVFAVQNQGTKPVSVFGSYKGDGLADVKLLQSSKVNPSTDYEGGKKGPLTKTNPSDELDPGDFVGIGLAINTHGVSVGQIETSVTINAASGDSQRF